MRIAKLAAAAVLAAAISVPVAAPAPPAQAAEPGAILFQDDFNGTPGAPANRTRWYDYSSATYNPSAAFGQIKPGDNEYLNGEGSLVIPATPTAGSAIRSRFSFQYGVVSAWIKMPPQPGYWPAFWTLNNDPAGYDHPVFGEADIMEFYSTWPEYYHALGHTWQPGVSHNSSPDRYCPAANLTTAFNKFTATIEPGKVSFSMNGVRCGTYIKDPAKPWGFGPDVASPNWLILDLAVGGADGRQTPATEPAQMLVSRIEVRALPSA